MNIRDDSPKEQAEVLVQIVQRKGTEGFRKFLHVLKSTADENPGHRDIISALESKQADMAHLWVHINYYIKTSWQQAMMFVNHILNT